MQASRFIYGHFHSMKREAITIDTSKNRLVVRSSLSLFVTIYWLLGSCVSQIRMIYTVDYSVFTI